jgi:hypothetical protein
MPHPEPEVFLLAEDAINSVVAQIADDQWDMQMPASFARRGSDHVPNLREIVNYHAYDDAWVPDMLAGRTMDEAGRGRFDGDLLGDDPAASFARIVDTACAAARGFTDLQRTMHLSFGDFTAQHYFWQINLFRGMRAWDLAHVINVPISLDPVLVEGIWEEVSPNAEEWREIGVFPARIDVPEDASLLERLLGITGRDPQPAAALR